MTKKTIQKQDSLEKILRYALGVRPDEFGLYPDSGGFVPLKALVAALHDEDGWRGIREGQIMMLVNQPGDQSPFEEKEALLRLKPTLASLPPEAPPASALPKTLFAALKPAAWAVISERGFYPKAGETSLRLWADQELALKVGRRLSPQAVMVTIQAVKARQAGAGFRPYSDLLWLTDSIPAVFLSGPPVPPRNEEAPLRRPQEKKPEPPPGSVFPPLPEAAFEVHRGKKKGRHSDTPDWKNQIRRDRRRQGRED
jgi:putative RNA 2'-phosphotransferase